MTYHGLSAGPVRAQFPQPSRRSSLVRIPIRSRAALICAALAAPLFGQSSQYSEPGTLGRPLIDRRQALRDAVAGARWHLGGLRLDPWLSLRELAWVEEPAPEGGTLHDLTATVGAGLQAYLPIGAQTTLAGQALPEYVWWRDRADARRLAGRYALGAFVFGNRTGLELVARSEDTTAVASPELDQRVAVRDDRLDGRLDLRLVRSLELFVRGNSGRVRTGDHDLVPEVARLDRDESWWVGGLAWRFAPDLVLGLGAGAARTEFVEEGDLRSNDGTTTYGELSWQRPKLQVAAEISRERREALAGSSFAGFAGDLGEASVRWQPRERIGAALYGLRRLSWSVQEGRVGYVDERLGAALDLRLGWRAGLDFFYESGTQEYVADLAAPRTDDVTSAGVGGRLTLGHGATVVARARRTRVENPGLGLRQDYSEIRFGLAFGGGPEGVF